ncbi:MAG: cell surface protein SprA [Leadbetterella sp.]
MAYKKTNYLLLLFLMLCSLAYGQKKGIKKDSTITKKPLSTAGASSVTIAKDTIPFKNAKVSFLENWKDTYLQRIVDQPSPFLSIYPDTVKSDVQLNIKNKTFEFTEKSAAQLDYKPNQLLNIDQYNSIVNQSVKKSLLRDYEKLQDGNSKFGGKKLNPLLGDNKIFDRLFGGKIPEFMPNGFIGIDLRAGSQFIDNPSTPIALRRSPIFDWDQQIAVNFNNLFNGSGSEGADGQENLPNIPNLDNAKEELYKNPQLSDLKNVLGRAGQVKEKMQITGNFDTKSAFNFENRFKLAFKNDPEDILQKIELGNVSMPNRSQLIPGVQNLLGGKIALKFGHLDITAVGAQQNSRTQSILINSGNQNRGFEIRCDNYDENRHFFLSQFFRDNYEKSLGRLPVVTSGVRITRVEVYVTNRTANVSSMRSLVGLSDLGETKPYKTNVVTPNSGIIAADNQANNLYSLVNSNSTVRSIDNTSRVLSGLSLTNGEDFELLRGAKRLTDREFEIQPELGYISLNTPLRNDEILAVAYEYTYQGRPYKVGELTEDYVSRKEDEVIMLKLIKSSTIRNRLNNPMWDLMMKNVYMLSQSQIKKEGFQLRIVYKDDATGLDSPNFKEGNLANKPILEALGLDRLNFNLDPLNDGNFDYIEGVTISEKYGMVIFPVLEPFGSHLAGKLSDKALSDKYVFNELYDKTLSDAQQVTLKNKFFLVGSVQSSGTEINLPLGASGSSVRVYAGGTELKEGVDFTVDSQLGRLMITNQSIMSSGRQIRIDYESPDLFQSQVRRLFGLRLDYTLSRNLRIGGTFMNLREAPPGLISRTSIGNEPVNNSQWGIDLNWKADLPNLTRFLDALPGIQTKEKSSIILNTEFAQLRPGVNNKRINGSSMIDDFEFARNTNDLSRQQNKWRLGSTPLSILNRIGKNALGQNPYLYNYNRAVMSIYTIDPTTYINDGFGGGGQVPQEIARKASNNIYEKAYSINSIFPGRSLNVLQQSLPSQILDVSFFPKEPGMYNYNPNLTPEGYLEDHKKSFGSIMRGLTFDADFDNANIEILEFWLLDPFKDAVNDGQANGNKKNIMGGKFKIHLGDVSEDVIPDSRFNFENGIKKDSKFSKPDTTKWGYAPKTQFTTDGFDTQESTRKSQDVGLDGLSNNEEQTFGHIKEYLDQVSTKVKPEVYKKIQEDPSRDDFKFFLDTKFDENPGISLLERFKGYLGFENNAPLSESSNSGYTQSVSNTADKEDINQDNTINEIEDYYEYELNLKPEELEVGKQNIVDKVNAEGADWFLFRIPIKSPTRSFPTDKEGFKSMRFIRMVAEEWDEPVVLRFASLQLVSNQYRVYESKLDDSSNFEVKETDINVQFNVSSVNVEENGCPQDGDCNIKKGTIPYVVPPGFVRDFDQNSVNQIIYQNEQSLRLTVSNLPGGKARAIFKNTQSDLNMYKRIKMFVHAENKGNAPDSAGAFLRIGTDLKNNYYEIEIPYLRMTIDTNSKDPTVIWPSKNEFDIPLDELRNLKLKRNRSNAPFDKIYGGDTLVKILGTESGIDDFDSNPTFERNYYLRIKGNPDLGNIMTMMIGIKNNDLNDKIGIEFTTWFDEFRAFGFDTETGEAGIFSSDIKLADLATVSLSGNFKNYGYGGVQDRISMRSREKSIGFGVASTIELDKFLPSKWGLSVPLFVNFDQQRITPEFNPLDPDIRLDDAISNNELIPNEKKNKYQEKFSRKIVQEVYTTKGFNFTNVHKVKTQENPTNHFYDLENFSLSYAKNSIERRNFLVYQYLATQNRAGLSYQYSPKPRSWTPFDKANKMDKRFIKNFKDLNFGFIPTNIGFRSDYDRSSIKNLFRGPNLDTTGVKPNIIKYFLGNRYYDAQWEFTKSISISYSSQMTAIQDDIDSITIKEVDFLKGISRRGRPKNFVQKIQATYQIPLDRFFLLDWIKMDSRYNNNYGFQAGFFEIKNGKQLNEFGNMVENGREFGLSGKVDLVKLYNKLKYLKAANTPKTPPKKFTRAPGDDEVIKIPPPQVGKTLARLLMAIRGINFNLSLIETTLLPGFLPSPTYFGLDHNNKMAPGLEFVMGAQNSNIHKIAAQKGWLSSSIIQNNPFTQTRAFKFDYSTSIEPFKGFRMVIKGNLSRGDSYQELYRTGEVGGGFKTLNSESPLESVSSYKSLNPVRNGNFTMSFWSFKTAFRRVSRDSATLYQYKVFDNMVTNRDSIKTKLEQINAGGEMGRYDINSQDVLIPAFFSAYSGQSLDKIFRKSQKRGSKTFNPFLTLPMPNWRIDYQGLEKLPIFRSVFKSITLNHSYSSTYSVGNFTSSLEYDANLLNLAVRDYPLGDKTLNSLIERPVIGGTAMFIPTFIMSTITMEEKLSPVIGVQFTTKSNFTGSFSWNKERKAMLNLSNAQVAETNANDFTFGFGFKRKNIKLPIRNARGKNVIMKNDANFRFDVTSRDLKVLQRKLDGDVVPMNGLYNLQIRPQVQYQINKRISTSMYFERLVNTPFTSLTYNTSSSIFGLNARFNLSD